MKWRFPMQEIGQKRNSKAKNIEINNNERKEESIRNERRRRQKKEYEDEFLEDLETDFWLHTTGSPDSATAPPRYYSQRLAKQQKRTSQWPGRQQHASKSATLRKLIKKTKSKLAPTVLDAMNKIFHTHAARKTRGNSTQLTKK